MKAGHERPINKTAALVVSRGETFDYKQLASEVCSNTPLTTIDLLPGEQDFTGNKFGRLTVIGKSDVKKRWVCRCLCGNYCHRRSKAIIAAANDSACAQCYLMAVSKRHDFIRRTGKERHTMEFL